MTAGEQYVAAAYLVVFVVVLAYVVIIATKLERLERALHDLSRARASRTDELGLGEPTRPAAYARAHDRAGNAQAR